MLDQVTAVSRVPAEFIGLARQFRTEVKAVDVAMDRALDVITAPLRARLARHPRLRTEMLPDLSRQYLSLIPAEFRVGKIEGTRHKTEFAIVERRLCVSWLRDDAWGDDDAREVGLSICKFTLSVHQGRLRQRWTPLVNASLHALARRVERHQDRSHEALQRDLALLADAGDEGEKVPTEGGFWLGAMTDANGEDGRKLRIRSVRTWLNTDG